MERYKTQAISSLNDYNYKTEDVYKILVLNTFESI